MLNVPAAVAESHLRGGCILWLGKVLCAPIDFADAFGHLLERPLATFPLSPVEVAGQRGTRSSRDQLPS